MTRTIARAATGAVLSVGLAGCGISHPPAASPAHTSQLALTHPSARAMYRDMTRALRRVHSVSVAAHIRLNHGPETTITYELQVPGRAEATVQSGGRMVNERYVGHMVYFRYNYAALFALTHNAVLADALHERWIGLPDSKLPLASSLRYMVAHKRMQECDVLGPSGRLSVGGTGMVDGLPTVTLHDHGGLPGTAPRNILVSGNQPYLPLAIRQTKGGRSGGTSVHDCFVKRDRPVVRRMIAVSRKLDRAKHIKLRRFTQTIDHYDFPLHLSAPPHPLLPDAQQAQTASSMTI